MNGITNQFISLDSSDLINVCQSDCVTFSGISDFLTVDRSMGMAFITTGTNQSVEFNECGSDNHIYDLGKGLSLTFDAPGGRGMISAADLTVVGFAQDFAGIVHLQPLQTEIITPDGRGGSFLDLGTSSAGGIVHFANDPVANLTAHIQAAVTA